MRTGFRPLQRARKSPMSMSSAELAPRQASATLVARNSLAHDIERPQIVLSWVLTRLGTDAQHFSREAGVVTYIRRYHFIEQR